MTLEGVRIGVGSSIFGTGAEFVRRLSIAADAVSDSNVVDALGFPVTGVVGSLGRTVELALSVIW